MTNSSFSGTGSGSTNSPAGGPSRSTVPTGVAWARAPETVPPGIAVTVTASSRSSGRDVTEYVRQCHTPSSRVPTPTYWPGR